eukprot:XP_010665280.1 PREDICTED: uncharacterized protein LOC104882720 [Vitis vinifera]
MIRGMHYKDFHIILSSTNSPIVMQKLLENIAFSIIFPGSGIPEWIWHQNAGSSIKIELPTDWYNDDFLGFAFFSVLEHLPERIICRLNSDVFYYGDLKDFGHDFHWKGNIVGSEHVWLGYQPCSQLRLFQFNDPNDWNRIEISFEAAQRFISSASNVVKKCLIIIHPNGLKPKSQNLKFGHFNSIVSFMSHLENIPSPLSRSKDSGFTTSILFKAYFSCGEDPTIIQEELAQAAMKYLTWHRTTSSCSSSSKNPFGSNSKDDIEGLTSNLFNNFCMISGNHASTLDRLFAWENITHHRGCRFLGTGATHAKEKMLDSSRERRHD